MIAVSTQFRLRTIWRWSNADILEAQPGLEPGYETVPHLRVAIPPPAASNASTEGRAHYDKVGKWLSANKL